jgi:hypothetical protein
MRQARGRAPAAVGLRDRRLLSPGHAHGAQVLLLQVPRGGRRAAGALGQIGRPWRADPRPGPSTLPGAGQPRWRPEETRLRPARLSVRHPTMSELLDRYLSEHAEEEQGPHRSRCRTTRREVIRPALGKLKVADVTPADVARFHGGAPATPISSQPSLAVLSKAFNLAELWGMRAKGTNPCQDVQRYPEVARERSSPRPSSRPWHSAGPGRAWPLRLPPLSRWSRAPAQREPRGGFEPFAC